MNALFTTAMSLREAGSGIYEGELDKRWTIGPKVHGGAMLALCANAAAVHAVVNLGEPEHFPADGSTDSAKPLLSANPVPDLMAPEPPDDIEPIGPGHPLAGLVHLGEGCDVRPVLSTMQPRPDGHAPVIQMWARPRGVAPDALFALMCGDLSAPVTFAVDRTGWAPTIQLTAFLRALPADGWLRIIATCTEIGHDWFDEDHTVVDSLGRLVVQARQLALVPAAR